MKGSSENASKFNTKTNISMLNHFSLRTFGKFFSRMHALLEHFIKHKLCIF